LRGHREAFLLLDAPATVYLRPTVLTKTGSYGFNGKVQQYNRASGWLTTGISYALPLGGIWASTDLATMGNYLQNIPATSAANPYAVEVSGVNLSSNSSLTELVNGLYQFAKLDLSDCMGTSFNNFFYSPNANKTKLCSVVLPSGLTSIGQYAFYGCSALATVGDLSGITGNIGLYAFNGCSALATVDLSGVNGSIGSYAFYNCTLLTAIKLGATPPSLAVQVFYNCPAYLYVPNAAAKVTYEANISGSVDGWEQVSASKLKLWSEWP